MTKKSSMIRVRSVVRHKEHQTSDMQNLEQQLIKGSELIALREDEREQMRGNLAQYMEYLPIRTHEKAPRPRVVRMPAFFRVHHLSGALVIALIATTSTYSVSLAAADALPGDLLYSVKVNVNEEVKTMFVSGDEESIAWERERTETRLEEASTLASQGRLDAERQEVVAKQLAARTEAVVLKVREVEARDPILAAEASAEFADVLDTHKAVLARMVVEQEAGGVEAGSARELVATVHRAAYEAEILRDETEEMLELDGGTDAPRSESEGVMDLAEDGGVTDAPVTMDDTTAQENKERAAYRAQERARELRAEAEALVAQRGDADTLNISASQHIATAVALIEEGDALAAAGRYGRAYTTYRNAASALHKTVSLLEVANTFTPELSAGMLAEEALGAAPVNTSDLVAPEDVDTAPVDTPETDDAESIDSVEVQTEGDTDLDAASPAETQALVDSVELQAREAIATVDRVLAGRTPEDAQVVAVRTHLNDAQASILRADIARSMGDESEAERLFAQALQHAESALAAITAEPLPAGAEGEQTATAASPMTIAHEFTNGVHFYAGSLSRGEECATLESVRVEEDVVRASYALVLATLPLADEAQSCAEDAMEPFRASTTAGQGMTVNAVILNGVDVPFSIVEAASTSLQTGVDSPEGILRTAIEGTQDFFKGR